MTLGAGIDTVNVTNTSGADAITVDLGDGNDDFNGSTAGGPVTVNGGGGVDTIDTGAGDDTINGGIGGDTMDGSDGRDTLSGGDGIDMMKGAGGRDTLVPGEGDDQVDGGPHKDTVSFADATGAVDVDLSASTASTGSDDDTLEPDRGRLRVAVSSDTVRGTDTNNDIRVRRGQRRRPGRRWRRRRPRWRGARTRLRGGGGDDDLFGRTRPLTVSSAVPGTDFCKGGKGRDRTVWGCDSRSPFPDVSSGKGPASMAGYPSRFKLGAMAPHSEGVGGRR